MAWGIIYTDEFSLWLDSVDQKTRNKVLAGIDVIAENGPALGRPLVDTMRASRHPNMKELRRGTYRVLFAFDPARQAVVLVGGDKRGDWTGWYERSIPVADDLYDQHLADQKGAR